MLRGLQGLLLAVIFIAVIAACYWWAAIRGDAPGSSVASGSGEPPAQEPSAATGVTTGRRLIDGAPGASTGQPVPLLATGQPVPLLATGQPVDWWLVFKFNSASFPGCGVTNQPHDYDCPFGGTRQRYQSFSQQFAYASSASPTLVQGGGCVGTTTADPVGATFDQVYHGHFNYVVWNDQFYDDPVIAHCQQDCGAPWGHSKGILAWNDAGEGVVMQVSTPSWPGAGSAEHPRMVDGNTLGCVQDNDVLVSQHFFASRLTPQDLIKVLQALQNASVVTDFNNPQVVHNGGPLGIQLLVAQLGRQSHSSRVAIARLDDGITLIAKPSGLHVPPWQLVSAELGGVGLRVASWWARPKIPSTAAGVPGCWDSQLGTPGPVEIATTGMWQGVMLGLTGGEGPTHNHAKIGVSTDSRHPYTVLGDMNQQGTLAGPECGSSQNGRGGLFFVVENGALAKSVGALIGE